MNRLRNHALYFALVVLVGAASFLLLFSPTAQAGTVQPDRQIFNENLRVSSGEALADNVAVFRGDVDVEAGGKIGGNLSVFSGDVDVAGEITGNLAVIGGDISLRASAQIGGDVSVVGGRMERERGAYVGGNFVGGPSVDLESLYEDVTGDAGVPPSRMTLQRSPLAQFFWRLVQAIFWTLLVGGLVVMVAWLAPTRLGAISERAETEPALSFATGFIVNLGVAFLAFLLSITICLAPVAFLLVGLLAIIALVGWAATCSWLGQRIHGRLPAQTRANLSPLFAVGASALVLTGATSFSWALLPCLGVIVAILLSSLGTGAVLVHFARNSGRLGAGANGPNGPDETPASPRDPAQPALPGPSE